MMRTILLNFFILLLLLFPSSLSAEIITLRSGKVIEGQVIGYDDNGITIQLPNQQYTIKYRMMASIARSSDPEMNSPDIEPVLDKFAQISTAIDQIYAKRDVARMQRKVNQKYSAMKDKLKQQMTDPPLPGFESPVVQAPDLKKYKRKIKQKQDVEFFVTSWCPYCRKMEELFIENGIKYTKYDIEKDSRGKKKYENLGVQGVPVTKAGEQIISGFNPNQVLNAISK